MNRIVSPSSLKGTVRAVTSKSCAHRMLICAALSDRPCDVLIDAGNLDIDATARCLTALGANIVRENEIYHVTPVRKTDKKALLDCGESGSTLRFILPVASALGAEAELVGSGRLPERPHTPLCDQMRLHGVSVSSDTLPMTVSGQLTGGTFTLPGNISSQYISGLLMAMPLLGGDCEIVLTTPLESASYIDLTRSAMARFGVKTVRTENGFFVPGGQTYRAPESVRVEGDWSAAAFWFCADAAGAAVDIDGLDAESAQGDRAMQRIMQDMTTLSERTMDAGDCPDLVPAVAAAAALVPGKTHIIHAQRLRLKECDRLAALCEGLGRMGADIHETEDGLEITGGSLRGAHVSGWNDHRIVMALAVAACFAEGETFIEGSEAVSKSYPGFWEDFESLGGKSRVEQAGK